MSQYFTYFPVISYGGVQARDISRRAGFIQDNLTDPTLFLPYTIRDFERPEDIADSYYGSVDYTWLVLLANDIQDPFTEWPMSDDALSAHLIDKYAAQANTTGYDVLAWAQNEETDSNIVFWTSVDPFTGDELRASPSTYTSDAHPPGWSAVRVYEWELRVNDERRSIQLVDKAYRDRVAGELKSIVGAS